MRRALLGFGLALLAAACDANVILLQPEQAVTGDAIALEVEVTDPALAERLGWTPGTGVPGATVHIRRDERVEVQSFVTDESGVLELPDLPSARYWVWVEKRFDDPPTGAPAVLAGGRLMNLRRGSPEQIEVRGQQRGSLVLSEFYYHHFWAAVYAFLTRVVEWADTAEREGWSDYVASSRARDIVDDSRRHLRQAQVGLPAAPPAHGPEFLKDFEHLVRGVRAWTSDGLYGSA